MDEGLDATALEMFAQWVAFLRPDDIVLVNIELLPLIKVRETNVGDSDETLPIEVSNGSTVLNPLR